MLMAAYKGYDAHVRGFLIGTGIFAIISVIIAVVVYVV